MRLPLSEVLGRTRQPVNVLIGMTNKQITGATKSSTDQTRRMMMVNNKSLLTMTDGTTTNRSSEMGDGLI